MGKIVFSKEEKEEYKRITLEKLLEGLSYRKIASYMGVSVDVVRRYTKELIQERKNYWRTNKGSKK